MIKRDWASKCSTGGWVAFFLLLAVLYAEGVAIFPKSETEPDYCKVAARNQDTEGGAATPAGIEDAIPSEPKARSGRDSEKCVQWRSAIATEIQARYTRFGFWLVSLTLAFTAWA